MEAAKSSDCCVACGRKLFSKKDGTNDLESCLMIAWAIDVDNVFCERWKRPFEEHKRIG